MAQGHHATRRQREAMPSTEQIVDEEPLVQASQRDLAAFGPLYERYQDRLYTYLHARTGHAEDAADLTQQVFVQALAALPRYRVQGVSFAAWLFRIARNAATDWQRRQRRTVSWDAVPVSAHPWAPETADGALLHWETFAPLYTIFAQLDAPTREALILRFSAHLTLAEIGAVLGKSEEVTRKQITRALQVLKEHYRDDLP